MVDFTMCVTNDCQLAESCRRKTATPSDEQSYSLFGGDNPFECEDYMPESIASKPAPFAPGTPEPLPRIDPNISLGAPVSAIEWSQGPCGLKHNVTSLRIEMEDEGGGAFFKLETFAQGDEKNTAFYFDSGDDLRKLADLADALLPPFTKSDVF